MTDSRRWIPDSCLVEEGALEYAHGRDMLGRIQALGVPVTRVRRGTVSRGPDPRDAFYRAKRTLIIAVKRSLRLDPCPPSAEFQFPLASGCPALCHYCYLHASPGVSPAVRAYANIHQLLGAAERAANSSDETRFEVASTSDPVAVEHITGSLSVAIPFFSSGDVGRLRFVTKFGAVDPLLGLVHQGRTTIRFSVNCQSIIRAYEPGTDPLPVRLDAARRVAAAGYPVGFMIAPIMLFPGWEEAYRQLVRDLASGWTGAAPSFELITHRFTTRGASLTRERFKTGLDLDPSRRTVKRGRYGHVKYVYPRTDMKRCEVLLTREIEARFPGSQVLYFT